MKWVFAPLMAGGLLAGALAMVALNSGRGVADTGRRTIVMEEMRFSPNRLDVKAGQTVVVDLINKGNERHDLAFPSAQMPMLAGIETLTMPGQSSSVTLRFDKPGVYEFLCTIPGHATAGMTGAVFVTP